MGRKKKIDMQTEESKSLEEIVESSTKPFAESPAAGIMYMTDSGILSEKPEPTRKTLRDENGLLKNVQYKFKENGFVDWRAMIPEQYVVLNREKFLKKDNPKDVDKLPEEEYKELLRKTDEKDKLIRLAGLKEVAQIRGYRSLKTEVKDFGNGPVATCTIKWIPNFETSSEGDFNYDGIETTGVADASLENTHGIASKYLSAISENRAVSRCIRNFLMIHTVSDEEVKYQSTDEFGDKPDVKSGPQAVIEKKLKESKRSFAELQQYIMSESDSFIAAETWEKPSDLSGGDATVVLGMFDDFLKK